MDILDTFNISGAGLSVQRVRLQSIASNMANARTTRTEEGGHYLRRSPVIEGSPINSFGDVFDKALSTVEVTDVQLSGEQGRRVFDPSHPDADGDGFVTYPEIDILHEMVDLMTTSRAYDANANVVEATKSMAQRALEIGR